MSKKFYQKTQICEWVYEINKKRQNLQRNLSYFAKTAYLLYFCQIFINFGLTSLRRYGIILKLLYSYYLICDLGGQFGIFVFFILKFNNFGL